MNKIILFLLLASVSLKAMERDENPQREDKGFWDLVRKDGEEFLDELRGGLRQASQFMQSLVGEQEVDEYPAALEKVMELHHNEQLEASEKAYLMELFDEALGRNDSTGAFEIIALFGKANLDETEKRLLLQAIASHKNRSAIQLKAEVVATLDFNARMRELQGYLRANVSSTNDGDASEEELKQLPKLIADGVKRR